MTHIFGFERSQLLLLPETVDDYVGADNPVRFIDAFVDQLDLAAAGFIRVAPKATGRPGYAPGDLLKLYIYGYLNRVRSSRRLEAECHRNIEVIWLLRSYVNVHMLDGDFLLPLPSIALQCLGLGREGSQKFHGEISVAVLLGNSISRF